MLDTYGYRPFLLLEKGAAILSIVKNAIVCMVVGFAFIKTKPVVAQTILLKII